MTDKLLHFGMIFLIDIFLDYYIRRINNNLEIDEKLRGGTLLFTIYFCKVNKFIYYLLLESKAFLFIQ